MLDAEQNEGIEASIKVLEEFLVSEGESFETFNQCMMKLNK
jgi:hypothetical protein